MLTFQILVAHPRATFVLGDVVLVLAWAAEP